jgi:hypothetical protein
MIYQHKARGADKAITGAIDAHVQDEQARSGENGAACRLQSRWLTAPKRVRRRHQT